MIHSSTVKRATLKEARSPLDFPGVGDRALRVTWDGEGRVRHQRNSGSRLARSSVHGLAVTGPEATQRASPTVQRCRSSAVAATAANVPPSTSSTGASVMALARRSSCAAETLSLIHI